MRNDSLRFNIKNTPKCNIFLTQFNLHSSDPASECIILQQHRPSPTLAMMGTASLHQSSLPSGALGGATSNLQRPLYHPHHRPRLRDGRRLRMYKSLSSSEDEVRSTPELSTEDDFDMESECISEPRVIGSSAHSTTVDPYRKLKPDEILDAKMRNFLVVSIFFFIF